MVLKPLLGLVFNPQKCGDTFVDWYKELHLLIFIEARKPYVIIEFTWIRTNGGGD
jgi:hypothetical protein